MNVLVTAGACGIGQAMAIAFAERGDKVAICDIDESALADMRARFPDMLTMRADVADEKDVDSVFENITEEMGSLDVLVNNAGVAGPTAAAEDIDAAAWRHTLAVNCDGTFHCTRRAIPMLKRSGGGSIVNISSTAGLFGYPRRLPYAAAKWAIIGMTKTLAMELGEFGIRVNAICPGSVDGARMDRVIAAHAKATGESESQVRDSYTRQASMRKFVTADDIANTALFLCSNAGAMISGQSLPVDGHTESSR